MTQTIVDMRALVARDLAGAASPAAPQAPGFLDGVIESVRSLTAQVSALGQSDAECVTEMLAMADDYESSQPSFAADLRAAAQRAQRDGWPLA